MRSTFVIMPNRLQIEIDNVKKFQTVGGSLFSALLLLNLTLPTLATTWNEQILAQSAPTDPNAPTDTPIPVRVDDRNNNNLWWLLILIPIGGLVWANSRSRRQDPGRDATVTPPIVPSIPVSSIDPALLDGRVPQGDLADGDSPVEHDRQSVGGLAKRDTTLESASGNGRSREAQVTTPLTALIPTEDRSTQSAVVVEELTIRHETSKMPVASVPEPDRHLNQHIRLLEERLVVDRHKRKAGEVVVRKEVETRFIRVPIQREVLIVEQVYPEFKQLAVVDLGQIHDDSIALEDRAESSTIAANFTSPTDAIEFLQSLAARSPSKSPALQLNIAIEDTDTQAFYRQWLEQQSVKVN